MEKRQLIESIRQYNAGVEAGFLEQFTTVELQEYLSRLQSAWRKEELIAGWVRPKPRLRLAS